MTPFVLSGRRFIELGPASRSINSAVYRCRQRVYERHALATYVASY